MFLPNDYNDDKIINSKYFFPLETSTYDEAKSSNQNFCRCLESGKFFRQKLSITFSVPLTLFSHSSCQHNWTKPKHIF